jgi:alanine racemase
MSACVQVNLSALRHNLMAAQQWLSPTSKLLAVVKANAYGHGTVPAARALVEGGARWLGVSEVADGVALRDSGLTAPILVMLPATGDEVPALIAAGLTATATSQAHLQALSAGCQAVGRAVTCHLYINTGLGRLGSDDSLPDLLDAAGIWPRVQVTGVYTHFGPPGSGQMLEMVDSLREGASVKAFAALAAEATGRHLGQRVMLHAAASELFVKDQAWHLDLVRLGNVLYGVNPDPSAPAALSLRDDTLTLKAPIISCHTLPKGSKVGYGGEFVCRRETRIATVPVGLSHGVGVLPESLVRRPRAVLKGWLTGRAARRGLTTHCPLAHFEQAQLPVIGRISMDQCCLDITDWPAIEPGTEVSLPVRKATVSPTLPRRYVTDDQLP